MFETKPEVKKKSIFDFCAEEETNYLFPISVYDSYEFSMMGNIKKTIFYKNSQFTKGANDGSRPFKNIIRAILNLQYRAEGFDVKDIEIFVDDFKQFYKSFLVRKFHERWARDNDLDTFIDEMVESYVDFGGVLVKNANEKPEVVQLQTLAFCDQTDILSAPFAIKHFFNPNELMDMADKGWGDSKNGATADIKTVISSAENSKKKETKTDRTTGKYIEVYEIHGVLPETYLNGNSDTYSQQMHIIVFNTKETVNNSGTVLYAKEEKEFPFKFLKRDPIYGRTLGMGGAEELFEAQVWTNYDMIRMKDLLDAAAKTLLKTTDKAFANRNRSLKNMENLEITVLKEGTDIGQIDTFPRNLALFDRAMNEWEAHAKQVGAASEAIMGESPASGTPFALQELVTAEAHSLHEYRKGKIATFMDEIYRDWIIPNLVKEITKGKEFLAELDLKEMQTIAENLVVLKANEMVKEKILNGELIDPEAIEAYKQQTRVDFMKSNKKFISILKGEMSKVPLGVKTNIVGKQKNLAKMTEKLVNWFRQLVANPGVLENPVMADLANQILESSGLSPIDFGAVNIKPMGTPLTTNVPLKPPVMEKSPIPVGQ